MRVGVTYLLVAFSLLVASPISSATAGDELTLWYNAPATEWTEALPVGNGRLGAMVFGGAAVERIQLNEESVWAGPPVPVPADGLAPALAEARQLFFAGKPAEGQAVVQQRILAPRISPRSYQTLGDLTLTLRLPGSKDVEPVVLSDWRRGPVAKEGNEAQPGDAPDGDDWFAVTQPADFKVPEHSSVVFRTSFELDDQRIAGGLDALLLSPIDDASVILLNGRKLGETRVWNRSHQFDVRGLLRPGRNTLVIAVRNIGGPGSFATDVRLVSRNIPDAYRRELDLETAISTTMFEHEGVRFTREVFSTAVDDVLVVRLAADRPGMINETIKLARPVDFETHAAGDRLTMQGRVSHGGQHLGVQYVTVAHVLNEGGAISTLDGAIRVEGADSVTILLAARTDYNFADPSSPLKATLVADCNAKLAAAVKKRYEQLRADHIRDYQSLFSRVTIDLGPNEHPDLPTNERLQRVIDGATDANLEALYFQFGRYLLIGSSRPKCMPANLQGLWNEHIEAPWNADYHTNINIQMNYWPAEVTNLSECHLPLFDLMEGMQPAGRRLASALGCRGIAFGHVTDAWMWTAVFGQCVYGMWPMAGGWLSSHMMEHYRFTQDRTFLKERAYPYLREASLFFLDWLVEDPETGLLVSGPTTSPENTYIFDGKRVSLSMGTSMDQQIIRETFCNTLEAAGILGIQDAVIGRIEQALEQLAPPRIGRDGRILEWGAEYEEAEPGHRHMSQMYGLHPGNQFTPGGTPELFAAARRTLDARLQHGGGHTGWSRAWLINFGARLLDAEFAHEQVRLLLAKSTLSNLFDNHPPFQIDGNFGGTAGMAEMLLQSQNDEIHLLPALPAAWPRGSVHGLCARGGYVVDIDWTAGRLTSATIRSKSDTTCRIRYGDQVIRREIAAGDSVQLTAGDFR